MQSIFLFPNLDKLIGSPNPYIYNFQNALAKKHDVVNKNASNKGVINLFLYFFKAKFFILNWIEYVSEKRFGKIQIFFFLIFVGLTKIFNKKIIWIMHNKGSHHKGKNIWVDFMFKVLMNASSQIITHSDSGLEFVKEKYPKSAKKVKVIIHPVGKGRSVISKKEKTYDFIIWGSIFPYKGLDKFFSFLKSRPDADRYKLLIVGKCFDEKYLSKIEALLPVGTKFINEVLSLDQIGEYAQTSQFTLFTYNSETVISSGSLMDAIQMGSTIIGPDHGAFRDLSYLCFIETYKTFGDIFQIYENYTCDQERRQKELDDFIKQNTWDSFIDKLEKAIV